MWSLTTDDSYSHCIMKRLLITNLLQIDPSAKRTAIHEGMLLGPLKLVAYLEIDYLLYKNIFYLFMYFIYFYVLYINILKIYYI